MTPNTNLKCPRCGEETKQIDAGWERKGGHPNGAHEVFSCEGEHMVVVRYRIRSVEEYPRTGGQDVP